MDSRSSDWSALRKEIGPLVATEIENLWRDSAHYKAYVRPTQTEEEDD